MTEEENNISPFINILYNVINKCSLDIEKQHICRWSSNGRSFLVLNGEHFMSLIHDFQKFKQRKQRIKTTNYRSLRRNLNYYSSQKPKSYHLMIKRLWGCFLSYIRLFPERFKIINDQNFVY